MGEDANNAEMISANAKGYIDERGCFGYLKSPIHIAFFTRVGLPLGLAVLKRDLCFYSKTSGSLALEQPHGGGMFYAQ